jgi:Ankyrin repeats (3 copies)
MSATWRRRLATASSLLLAVIASGAPWTAQSAPADTPPASLWQMVQEGSLDKVKAYLATPGVEVNDRYVVGVGRDDMNMLMDDKALLDFAAEANQAAIATYLIDRGARVNAPQQQGLDQGMTALHRAAYTNAAEITELLIVHGANVNAKHGTIANGLGGATPLLYATANGSLKTIDILLRHGADPTVATVAGNTALSTATQYRHPEAVPVLQDYLSNPRTEGLLDAARNGHLDAVRGALAQQSDGAAMDGALRLAMIAGSDRQPEHEQIVALLIDRGARIGPDPGANAESLLGVAFSPEVAALLLAHGADAKLQSATGAALLKIACNPVVGDPTGRDQSPGRAWRAHPGRPGRSRHAALCCIDASLRSRRLSRNSRRQHRRS